MRTEWKKFKVGDWCNRVNVRDFIAFLSQSSYHLLYIYRAEWAEPVVVVHQWCTSGCQWVLIPFLPDHYLWPFPRHRTTG